jgi:hypothetical protein
VLTFYFIKNSQGLDPNPAPLEAGVVDGPPKHFLAARADVGDVDPQRFQTLFELFQGEIVLVQHDWSLSCECVIEADVD